MVELAWHEQLSEHETERLRDFLRAVGTVDGRPEVAAEGPLPREFRGGAHGFATSEGHLVGYVHLDNAGDAFGRAVGELYVDPDYRGRGLGGVLLAELVRGARVTDGQDDRLRVWAHGDRPDAGALAARHGLERVRELHQMRRPNTAGELAEPRLPDGVTLRAFVPGRDEHAVARVNARAFEWHPEQGVLTVSEITAAETEAWFDAPGFLLAERDGGLLGFHWTKVHPGDEPVGEVYVVGVHPDAQGSGLGTALTLAGLRYLWRNGVRTMMLYVEADNPAAIAVYRKLGFDIVETDVQYAR